MDGVLSYQSPEFSGWSGRTSAPTGLHTSAAGGLLWEPRKTGLSSISGPSPSTFLWTNHVCEGRHRCQCSNGSKHVRYPVGSPVPGLILVWMFSCKQIFIDSHRNSSWDTWRGRTDKHNGPYIVGLKKANYYKWEGDVHTRIGVNRSAFK